MKFLNHVATIMAIVGVLVELVAYYIHDPRVRKVIASIGFVFITIGIVGFFTISNQSIEIVSPIKGGDAQCFINPQDGQLTISKLSVKLAEQMKKSEKIAILMQVGGGNEWWLSGNTVSQVELSKDNVADIGFITFGTVNDNNCNYNLLAIITDSELSTSQKIISPQKFAKCSALATFQKNRGSILRTQ